MRKRREFTTQLKAKICLQILTGAKSTAQICREHQINENLLSRWKKQFVENASLAFEGGGISTDESERVAELEKLVGRLTMELEISKKASMNLTAISRRNGR